MFNAVRFTQKTAVQTFQAYALLLIALSSAALTGCSGLVTASNSGGGTLPPLTISGVQAATPTTSGFQVSWSTNVAANSVVDYGTTANYGSSTPISGAMVTSHQVAVTGLTSGTLYHFRVRSTDANNSSISSADMTFSTAGDTTPPTAPTGLTATAISSSQINLTWTASTDNVGVTGYNVFRGGVKIGTAPGTSFQDSGLSASTSYTYNVSAFDAAGNTSAQSAGASATTQAVDTTPPTVSITGPANGATVSGTVSVLANASDNVGVASVQFTLDGSNLGSALTASPYQVAWDTTTTSNASHLVGAVARDAAGNVGNATAVSVTVSNSGNTALQDFQTRCATPGVIVCEGFDSAAEFVPAVSPNSGLYPGVDNTIEIVQDTTVFASGGGSLHFPIKANDGTGATVRDDNWLQTFCSAHPPAPCSPTVFGPNSTFYVQFRYRVDAGYANTNWENCCGTSPKIADFAYHNQNCGQTEITTNNRNGTDAPMMYTNCGSGTYGGIYTLPGTTNAAQTTNPPYNWQSGYYNCTYPQTPSGPGGCFTMPVNTWMTFYYAIQPGSNGQFNSHITAWVGLAGQPLEKFMEVSNFPLNFDTPGYDAIWFNVYMTGFLPSGINPAANAWLDEVIVSSAPVPAPAANGGGIPQ